MFLGFWSHMNSLSIRQFVRQDACILGINFKWMNEGWGCLIRCGHYMTLPGLPLPGQAEDLAKHARWDWAQAASRAAFPCNTCARFGCTSVGCFDRSSHQSAPPVHTVGDIYKAGTLFPLVGVSFLIQVSTIKLEWINCRTSQSSSLGTFKKPELLNSGALELE